jgi:hypothetical protein
MAFNTTQALETTVLSDKRLAFISLAILYAVFTGTTVFAPKIVALLGPRTSMILGAVPYVTMVFVNIDPSWGSLPVVSAGVGAGAAVLWTAQGIYMSRCAIREAAETGEPVDAVTSRLNGLFFTAFQFNGAVGLVISSIILQAVPSSSAGFKNAIKCVAAWRGHSRRRDVGLGRCSMGCGRPRPRPRPRSVA